MVDVKLVNSPQSVIKRHFGHRCAYVQGLMSTCLHCSLTARSGATLCPPSPLSPLPRGWVGGCGLRMSIPPPGGWVGGWGRRMPPRGVGGSGFDQYQCTPPPIPAKSWSPVLSVVISLAFALALIPVGNIALLPRVSRPQACCLLAITPNKRLPAFERSFITQNHHSKP
jgi:hypothetical protein